MSHFNELLCPNCGEPLNKQQLHKRLICPHCRTNLKNERFMDFLEYIVEQGIIDSIDFFDTSLYGNDFLKYEVNELDDDETGTSSGNTQNFLDDNMITVEDEFIADLQTSPEENDDYTVFNIQDEEDEDND